MFYCNKCAKKRNWQETAFKSKGRCEICKQVAICNERKSSELPYSGGCFSLYDVVDRAMANAKC